MTKETEYRARMLLTELGMENGGSMALIAAMTGGYITYGDTGNDPFRLRKKNEFEYEITLNSCLKGNQEETENQTAMAISVLFICYDFHYIAKTAERMMAVHSSLAKNSRKWHREKAGVFLDLNAGYDEARDFANALLNDGK
jgi:hypothetical protein